MICYSLGEVDVWLEEPHVFLARDKLMSEFFGGGDNALQHVALPCVHPGLEYVLELHLESLEVAEFLHQFPFHPVGVVMLLQILLNYTLTMLLSSR